ncbi:CBM96 family carbohydrate-binding protein [Vibrio sp. VB16]|uniref:CBM96 family carbohydrate-binding protein n=1 Tax=Vibrio sp. VB16 TaxID=2785746 RepID=UPI00189F76A3|nr:polysaccharide lyase family 8 super-sandwich domain-containing protein [Vibrio sp. VB16]UGA55818.1 DNRLRE domain-containing protein [Vibrio sp. VB16]
MKIRSVLQQSILAMMLGALVTPVSIASMSVSSVIPEKNAEVVGNSVIDGIALEMADYIDKTHSSTTDVSAWIVPISKGGLFDPETGKWSDIDYTYSTSAAFSVTDHLDRLLMLARSYTNVRSIENNNPAILSVLSSGMKSFAQAEYSHSGWWFNYIGIPQRVGELLVYIKAKNIPVNQADYQALVDAKYLNVRSHWSYGRGANAIDISIANMYSGVVRNNEKRLSYYVNEALNEIGRSGIGINADNSFFAHGPMLNTNSYGWVLVMRTLQVENFTRNYFTMAANSQSVLESFMDQGVYPTFRGRYHDYLTGGRGGVSREGNLGRGFSTYTLARLNPDRAEHFNLVNQVTSGLVDSDKMPYRGAKAYWNSDYLLKNEQAYQYSALTHSPRTLKIEQINAENLLGSLMSMGSHSIRVSGDEYFDIFPLWDWLKIPGVTGREGQEMSVTSGARGIDFSGVMSTGNQAIMVHSQNKLDVVVKKANFVFDDVIIAIASEVTATEDGKVTTSLDQSWFRDEVKIGLTNGDSDEIETGSYSYNGDNLAYVLHNGIAYMPLDSNTFNVSVEDRTSQWTKVNSSQSNRDVTGTVFSAWIDHGNYPSNDTFSYAIYPGVSADTVADLSPRSRFDTYQEGDTLAVYDKRDDVLQVVLREAGQWNNDELTLVSDQVGMFIVTSASSSTPTLYFADPDQAYTLASVSLYNTHGSASIQLTKPDYKSTNVSSAALNIAETELQYDLELYASADTFVRYGGYSDENYGTSERLAVKADSNSAFRRHVFLKFPIDTVNTAALNSAMLELSVFNIGSPQPVIAYLLNDNSWDEFSIVANSAPAAGEQISSALVDNGTFKWDLSDVIRTAKEQGESAISLKLGVANNGTNNWVTFNSKESSATAPVINIDYNAQENQVVTSSDAFVQGGSSANLNFGQDSRLIVKLDPNSTSLTRETFLKFPISNLESDGLSLVEIDLQVKGIGAAMTLNVEQVSSEWSEDNVTFNSAVDGTELVVSVPLVTTDQSVKVNITDMVKAAIIKNKQEISLRLYSVDEGGTKYATFYSKESDEKAPTLISTHY